MGLGFPLSTPRGLEGLSEIEIYILAYLQVLDPCKNGHIHRSSISVVLGSPYHNDSFQNKYRIHYRQQDKPKGLIR